MVDIVTEQVFTPLSELIEENLKILNGLISYYEKSDLK